MREKLDILAEELGYVRVNQRRNLECRLGERRGTVVVDQEKLRPYFWPGMANIHRAHPLTVDGSGALFQVRFLVRRGTREKAS